MSHIAEINLELRDMDALAKAADALGLSLVRDAQQFTYYGGQKASCIHKLVLKDAKASDWEIGLVYTDMSQTAVRPAVDFFGPQGQRLIDRVGRDCVELKKRYTAEVSAGQMRKQGYRVQVKADGGRYRISGTK